MANPNEVNTKKVIYKDVKKFVKITLISVAGFILLVLLVLGMTGQLSPKTEPIVSITNKTCQFVVMGNTSRAICTDGSQYKVELLVNPLP